MVTSHERGQEQSLPWDKIIPEKTLRLFLLESLECNSSVGGKDMRAAEVGEGNSSLCRKIHLDSD